MSRNTSLVPVERIEQHILMLRGHKVLLDRDLAELYGVTTGNLNKAVTRNLDRFPEDFMFRLSRDEFQNLIFHSGTSSWGGTGAPPRALTRPEPDLSLHARKDMPGRRATMRRVVWVAAPRGVRNG